jgi:DNA-binding response OmpR family regulator
VTVLVADDDRITARVLEKRLRSRGYEVQVVYAGTEAWDALIAPTPPLVAVLDWTMPGISGPELCRNVRAREAAPFVYLMLLTGRDQTADVTAGMDAGADEYVQKPFELEDLCQRIGHGLQMARSLRTTQMPPSRVDPERA